jgi:hypothetical protein
MSKLQKKPSALKREHPALQKMKFVNFFLSLWAIFALVDPDPLHWFYFNCYCATDLENAGYKSFLHDDILWIIFKGHFDRVPLYTCP